MRLLEKTSLAAAATAVSLTSCQSEKPFDPARCQLEMQTRIESGLAEAFVGKPEDAYLVFVFETSRGDKALLNKFLEPRGYFQAANDPNDSSMRNIAYYFPNRETQYGQKVADQRKSAETACQASYLARTRLISINGMGEGSSDLLFTAELQR